MTTYETAHQEAVWRDMSHFGRFRVAGADAATLLHHLTTNDIKGLRDGQGCEAVLVSSKARVLDLLSIFRLGSEYLVMTSPNRRPMFAPHAQKFVLYRQDVKIEDQTEDSGLIGIFGPGAEHVLQKLGINAMQAEANRVQQSDTDGTTIFCVRTSRLPLDGALLWSENKSALLALVQSSVAPQCDNETYNVLRVEAGLPVAGLELTEDINPWEADLGSAISLHKGCYNGQEIIARLNTYQKVKQRLMGVRLSAPVATQPAPLRAEGRDAGWVSSSVQSPLFGTIGLAYVRGAYAEAGQELGVQGAEGTTIKATVCELPFAPVPAVQPL